MKTKKTKVWACSDCGATTTDPTQSLIVYFHRDCPEIWKDNNVKSV